MNRLAAWVLLLFILPWISSCNLYHALGGHWKHAQPVDSSAHFQTNDSSRNQLDSSRIITDTSRLLADTGGHTDTSKNVPLPDTQKQIIPGPILEIWNYQTPFHTFSGKARVHYEGKGENQDISLNIRIERDKQIWISITALGLFEAFRVLITPDTIFAIDRIHKTVQVLPFRDANKILPMAGDFNTLQSLLLGNALRIGLQPMEIVDSNTLVCVRSNGNSSQEIRINKQDSSLIWQMLHAPDASLESSYSDYDRISQRKFSKTRNMVLSNKGDTYIISFDFSTVAFDEPVEMNFVIPEKYERK